MLQRPVFLAAVLSLCQLTACGGGSDSSTPVTPPGNSQPQIALQAAFPNLAFTAPVVLSQAPGDSSRWFVAEQNGVIRVFDNSANASGSAPFLDIAARVDSSSGEAGLLGFAFHPGFPAVPEVFVSYTATGPGSGVPLVSRISRFYSVNGGISLDPLSEEILLRVPQDDFNHNGGHLAFGSDGYLYAGFGDGGGAGDPNDNSQNTGNLLGTIVRIDVDGGTPYAIPPANPFSANPACNNGPSSMAAPSCPEIFAWGLRNPWRFSFDSTTADLWVGDVGQTAWEEINRVTAGGNYGWNDREGAHCFQPASGCATTSLDPVAEYGRSAGQSVTGGYVYRGSTVPALAGRYVFADFVAGRIFAIAADSQPTVAPAILLETGMNISTFASDVAGELYVVDYATGAVHRIVAAP